MKKITGALIETGIFLNAKIQKILDGKEQQLYKLCRLFLDQDNILCYSNIQMVGKAVAQEVGAASIA